MSVKTKLEQLGLLIVIYLIPIQFISIGLMWYWYGVEIYSEIIPTVP